MTYGQAHNIIHDQPPDEDNKIPPPLTAGAPVDPANIKNLKKDLTILTQLARKLRKDREDIGGAVDLSSGDQGNELKFTLDKDNNPIKVNAKKQMEIHNTIAELMILSNTWVAKTIYNKSSDSALLRNHRSVEDSRFEDLKAVLDAGKIAFDGKDNMALANSLKAAETATKSNSTMQSLFQSLATRYFVLSWDALLSNKCLYLTALTSLSQSNVRSTIRVHWSSRRGSVIPLWTGSRKVYTFHISNPKIC